MNRRKLVYNTTPSYLDDTKNDQNPSTEQPYVEVKSAFQPSGITQGHMHTVWGQSNHEGHSHYSIGAKVPSEGCKFDAETYKKVMDKYAKSDMHYITMKFDVDKNGSITSATT